MAVHLLDMNGSPNIGVYSLATDLYAILPPSLPKTKIKALGSYLKVKCICTTVGGSNLIGALAVANSYGIILPHYTYDEEIEAIRSVTGLNVERINCKKTAFGNLVLANDHGALIDPRLERERGVVKKIEDTLGVEVVPGRIAGSPYVGALAVATNKGVLAHPMLREAEGKVLEDVLKVHVDVGTINQGVPIVGSGLIANKNGAVAGFITSGPEIVIIGQVLDVVA